MKKNILNTLHIIACLSRRVYMAPFSRYYHLFMKYELAVPSPSAVFFCDKTFCNVKYANDVLWLIIKIILVIKISNDWLMYSDQCICQFGGCLLVCSSTHLKKLNFTKFSLHVICRRGSLQCHTLCTSGFVMTLFSYNENRPNQRRRVYFDQFARWRQQLDVKHVV